MTPEKCPRCGTILIKETTEASTSDSMGSGSLYPPPSNSKDYEGSISVIPKSTYDAWRCPKCGYLFVDW